MPNVLDKMVDQLHSTKAGYVHRRDAAVALGKTCRRAFRALEAHRDDADIDVRMAVQEALRNMAVTSLPVDEPEERVWPLERLAEACEKKGRRERRAEGEGFIITVQTGKGRSQEVHLVTHTRKDGTEFVQVFTRCAKANEENLRWALRHNGAFPHCAFGLRRENGEEHLVLIAAFEQEKAQPEEIKIAVKAVAAFGDWFEDRLTKEDNF